MSYPILVQHKKRKPGSFIDRHERTSKFRDWSEETGGGTAGRGSRATVDITMPTAFFSCAPTTSPNEIQFTDASQPGGSGTIAITSWEWVIFDDSGTTYTEQNPKHTFPAAGTYTVMLRVRDEQGKTSSHTEQCTTDGTGQTTVAALTLTGANVCPLSEIPKNAITADATGSVTDDPPLTYRYRWLGAAPHDDPLPDTATWSDIVEVDDPGSYILEVSITDATGATDTATAIAAFGGPPGLITTPPILDGVPEEGVVVDFTYTSSPQGIGELYDARTVDITGELNPNITIVAWAWEYDDHNDDGEPEVTPAPRPPPFTDTYPLDQPVARWVSTLPSARIKLTVTDSTGATHTTIKRFFGDGFTRPPKAGFTYSYDAADETYRTIIATDTSITQTNPIATTTFYFGDSNFSVATPGNRVTSNAYQFPGTYVIRAESADDAGTVSDPHAYRTVVIPNPAGGYAPSADFTTDLPVMSPGNVVVEDASVPGNEEIASWSYDWGDGTPVTNISDPTGLTGLVHTYAATGEYLIVCTVTDECGLMSRASRWVLYDNAPKPTARFVSADTALPGECVFENTSIQSPDGADIVEYRYDWGDGTTTTVLTPDGEFFGQDTFHRYTENGRYPVTLTVFDESDRSDTFSRTIRKDFIPTPTADFRGFQDDTSDDGLLILEIEDLSTPDEETNGTILKWTWDFGDGSPPLVLDYLEANADVLQWDPLRVKHLYPNEIATYMISLLIEDEDGNQGYTALTSTVVPTDGGDGGGGGGGDGLAQHPYDIAAVQDAMSESKLQFPGTSSFAEGVEMDGLTIEDVLYVADDAASGGPPGGSMVMSLDRTLGDRIELRHQPEWSTSSTNATPQRIKARVRVEPIGDLSQFTIAQIHSDDYLTFEAGVPLRLVYRRSETHEGTTYDDHIWINCRKDLIAGSKINEYVPILPRPPGYFDFEMRVDGQITTVSIDGNTLQTLDWSFLQLPENYFKIGSYLNSEDTGTARIYVSELQMGPDSSA